MTYTKHPHPAFDTQVLVADLQRQVAEVERKVKEERKRVEKAVNEGGPAPETKLSPKAELWSQLRSMRAFRKLEKHDRLLLWACLAVRIAMNDLKLGSASQYGRECANAAKTMEPVDTTSGPSKLMALLGSGASLATGSVLDLKSAPKSKRISALKSLAKGARGLEIIEHADIEDVKVRRSKPDPKPCSDADLKAAADLAVQLILDRSEASKAFPKQIRDAAMLDVKSYDLRSIEMEWTTRGDFLRHHPSLPIRVSKTENGKRTMVLDLDTVALVFAYLAELDAYRAQRGLRPLGDDDPLWMGVMGRGLTSRSISSHVGHLLPDGVRAHQLRGRIATKLLKTRSLPDVAVALGINQRSVEYYAGAADAFGIMSDVATFHAPIDLTAIGIEPAAPESVTHQAPSRPESSCWLPEDILDLFEAGLDSDTPVSSAAKTV